MAYPSTYFDLQNAVATRMRIDSPNELHLIGDLINQVYAQACVETECLQEDATLLLTANVASYTFPAAILRIKKMVVKQASADQYGPPLQYITLDEMLQRRQSNGGTAATNGTATHYALAGLSEFELWPTPGAADTLLLFYTYAPTPLSDGDDLPVIPEPYATRLLENGAMAEIAAMNRDQNENVYRQLYESWLMRLRQHLRRREGSQTRQLRKQGNPYWPPHDPSLDVRVLV